MTFGVSVPKRVDFRLPCPRLPAREVHMLRSSIAAILMQLPVCLLAQKTNGTKPLEITLHVTSVSQEEDMIDHFCGTDPDCQATVFMVEGYADGADTASRTEYVLKCVQILARKPSPHVLASCGSIHANNDYHGRVFDNSISFWPAVKYTPPPFRGTYAILSEKEIRK
jgi:hypothetical protein